MNVQRPNCPNFSGASVPFAQPPLSESRKAKDIKGEHQTKIRRPIMKIDSSHSIPSSERASGIVRTAEEIKEEEDQEVIES